MMPADSAFHASANRPLLPSLQKRESAALREEIAALEKSPKHEDPLLKRWKSFEKDVSYAQQKGPMLDDLLRRTEDSLSGFTMCPKKARLGRCVFVDGKCKHCDRIESSFRQAFSVQCWREQEQKVWEEQKAKERAAMEAEYKQKEKELQEQREQLEIAKLNFKFERDQVLEMVRKERQALEVQREELGKKRIDLQQWHDQLKQLLQAELEKLHEKQRKAAEEAELRSKELSEIDKQCQKAFVQFEEEKNAWEQERDATQQAWDIQQKSLIEGQSALQTGQSKLEQEVADFKHLKQEHALRVQEYRGKCQRWLEEERMAMQHRRLQEQRLLRTHSDMYEMHNLKQLERARAAGRQVILEDSAYIAEAYPSSPVYPAANLVSAQFGVYHVPPGPPFPPM